MTKEKILDGTLDLIHNIDEWIDVYKKANLNGDKASLAGAQSVLNMYFEQARYMLEDLYNYIKQEE